MHLSIAPGRERKYFNSCTLMSSAHVVMLAQLPNKLHFPTTFFGPFFYVVEAGKLLLGIVPGLLNPITLTLSQHLLQPLWHAECHGGTESVVAPGQLSSAYSFAFPAEICLVEEIT